MIDLHCHILPGLDDGPDSFTESIEIARAAADDGALAIVATPHVSVRYRNSAERIAELHAELQSELKESFRSGEPGSASDPAVYPRLFRGAEIAATVLADLSAEELAELTLGRGPWLLIEPPFVADAVGLETALADLQQAGFRVVLAHPERCPSFQRDPPLLQSLVAQGALTSVTAGSLAGRFGTRVRAFASEMVRAGLVHNVASDAHDLTRRPPGLKALLEGGFHPAVLDWLLWEVPLAILGGGQVPAPPRPFTVPPRSRGRWLRRRTG